MNNKQFLQLLNESNNTFNNLTGIQKLNESELPNIKLKNKKQIGIFRIIEIDGENFTLIKEKDTKYINTIPNNISKNTHKTNRAAVNVPS